MHNVPSFSSLNMNGGHITYFATLTSSVTNLWRP